MEIAEGLWRLGIPMRYNPLGCTHSYLLADAATLIDTGIGTVEARNALEKQLREAGLRVSDIERIIITHTHRDHVGLVGYVKSVSGAELYAHERATEVLQERLDHLKRSYDELRREIKMLGGGGLLKVLSGFGAALRRRAASFNIDNALADGDLLRLGSYTLRVIWTPGHAPEHICLYDGDRRLLFSGDHVLPRVTPHIGLHAYEDADPLGAYLRSLAGLRGLPVDLVLPGHEDVFEHLEGRIEEIERHHKRRCDEIKAALREGERTVFQISARIAWDSRPWPLMPFWTKLMAAAETLAHLVYLRNRGEVIEKRVNAVLYYSLRD